MGGREHNSCTSTIHKVGDAERKRNLHKLFICNSSSSCCTIKLLYGLDINDNIIEGMMDRFFSTLLIEMDGVSKSSSKHYSDSKGVIGWYQKLETDVSFLNEKFRQHT